MAFTFLELRVSVWFEAERRRRPAPLTDTDAPNIPPGHGESPTREEQNGLEQGKGTNNEVPYLFDA
jgi:hypothetical protein